MEGAAARSGCRWLPTSLICRCRLWLARLPPHWEPPTSRPWARAYLPIGAISRVSSRRDRCIIRRARLSRVIAKVLPYIANSIRVCNRIYQHWVSLTHKHKRDKGHREGRPTSINLSREARRGGRATRRGEGGRCGVGRAFMVARGVGGDRAPPNMEAR